MVLLGETFPDFKAKTSNGGEIKFHDFIGDSWVLLMSHPADFTPVCTTELVKATELHQKFANRDVKLLGISCDSAETHDAWIKDIKELCDFHKFAEDEAFPFPIIDDSSRKLCLLLGMLNPEIVDTKGVPLPCRNVFFIGPDKKLKFSIAYPAYTGRNFHEILRVIDSVQLCHKHKYEIATPADWQVGDAVMVHAGPGGLPQEVCVSKYPEAKQAVALPSGKEYMIYTSQHKFTSEFK